MESYGSPPRLPPPPPLTPPLTPPFSTAIPVAIGQSGWKKRARHGAGELSFGRQHQQQDLTLKGVEALSRHHAEVCFRRLSQDLDQLHDQVHNEIYEAVKQELAAVAHSIFAVRKEVSQEIQATMTELITQHIAPLRGYVAANLTELSAELRRELETRLVAASREMRQTLEPQADAATIFRDDDAHALISELKASICELADAASNEVGELRVRFGELDKQWQVRFQGQDDAVLQRESAAAANSSAALVELQARVERAEAVAADLQARVGGVEATAVQLEVRVSSAVESKNMHDLIFGLERKFEASMTELEESIEMRRKQATQATGEALQEMERVLEEAVRDLGANSESTRSALDGKLRTMTGVSSDRYDAFEKRIESIANTLSQTEVGLAKLQDVCSEGQAFSESCWARTVQWTADVDVALLEREGNLDLESPVFAAAGMRGLRLLLTIKARPSGKSVPLDAMEASGEVGDHGSQRFVCGAFLCAPVGEVSFKLTVGSRTQTFAASFGETPKWGSHRLAVLDRLDLAPEVSPANLTVKLEILDVVTFASLATTKSSCGDKSMSKSTLSALTHIVEPSIVASREVAAFRASMVRKVEWKVGRISERVAQARKALDARVTDEEQLEPLCSPPFAAGGVDGMQLMLYPVGYRSRSDNQCGFFLACPAGTFIRCKAFVGDVVRTFEHTYDGREPFGRGNFSRLEERADGDDCVVCGIEILEVRQEQCGQIRGGPFGNISDQLKVIVSPNANSMELVRELREVVSTTHSIAQGSTRSRHSSKHSFSRQDLVGAIGLKLSKTNQQTTLASSKSLPSLTSGTPPWPSASPYLSTGFLPRL